MNDIPIINNYPYWRYQRVTLIPAASYVSAAWQVLESNDFLLERIAIQYQTVGGAPSTFTDVQALLYDWQHGKDTNSIPIPLMLIGTPGRVENFVGSGKHHNTAWVNSKTINWVFEQKSSFEIRFSNMATVNNNIIDVLIFGRNIMLEGETL